MVADTKGKTNEPIDYSLRDNGEQYAEKRDVEQRKAVLALLKGIEHMVWVQVDGFGLVPATANEDLERSTEEKTSAVHFMRFELDAEMISALRKGAELAMGADHPHYSHQVQVPDAARESLVADFD